MARAQAQEEHGTGFSGGYFQGEQYTELWWPALMKYLKRASLLWGTAESKSSGGQEPTHISQSPCSERVREEREDSENPQKSCMCGSMVVQDSYLSVVNE